MDIESLVRAAESSREGENYLAVYISEGIKLGVSAVMQPSGECQFFAELVINLCSGGREADIEWLDGSVRLIRSMKVAGYEIACDGGEFACEKKVSLECLENELAGIRKLIGIAESLPTP